jgi:hypothetical protein
LRILNSWIAAHRFLAHDWWDHTQHRRRRLDSPAAAR